MQAKKLKPLLVLVTNAGKVVRKVLVPDPRSGLIEKVNRDGRRFGVGAKAG